MSANTLKFITTFLSVGKINPKKNPINEIINNDAAMIVIVVILLNFNVNNCII